MRRNTEHFLRHCRPNTETENHTRKDRADTNFQKFSNIFSQHVLPPSSVSVMDTDMDHRGTKLSSPKSMTHPVQDTPDSDILQIPGHS